MVLALALVAPVFALPVKPDVKTILRQTDQPRREYPAARAGADRPEDLRAAVYNPIYEQLRYRYTPAGRRDLLLRLATPDPFFWTMLALLIFTLRYYRWSKPRRQPAPAKVISFPALRDAA